MSIKQSGCPACHTSAGIAGAGGRVGPPLTGVGGRSYLAGRISNTPEHMIRWLLDPQSVDSLTAMPATGLTELEARDVAAYLYRPPVTEMLTQPIRHRAAALGGGQRST